jgi:hypothetical protein
MAPRDTRTGGVLEQMVLPALKQGGYTWETQVNVGERLGGGKHYVDVVASDRAGNRHLISLKWQQTSGTAEQKVPYEIMCLAEAILTGEGEYKGAYLVLGGSGWRLRDYYTSGDLGRHLVHADKVTVVTLEDFVATANGGKL